MEDQEEPIFLLRLTRPQVQFAFLSMLTNGVILKQFIADPTLCNNDELLTYLPYILHSLKTNFSMEYEDVKKIIRDRISRSTLLQMHVYWMQKCKLWDISQKELLGNITLYTKTDEVLQKLSKEFIRLKKDKTGEFIPVDIRFESPIADPIFGMNARIEKITMLKTFESKTKPCLISFNYEDIPGAPDDGTQKVLYKSKDDVELDYAVLTVFSLCNKLWEAANMVITPVAYTYSVIPIAPRTGLVEFVSNSKVVRGYNWGNLSNLNFREQRCFVASLAGAFIASLVLGISDRHQDNMMVKNDKVFFHIDFGWCFGKHPSIDAETLAIPVALKEQLEKLTVPLTTTNLWDLFLDTSVDAYRILRRQAGLLLTFTVAVFHKIPNVPSTTIQNWIHSVLHSHATEEEAISDLRKQFKKGIGSWNTWLKDFAHEWKHRS